MRNRRRVVLFAVGFVPGTLLVLLILQHRSQKESVAKDPWFEHNAAAIEAGVAPLPEHVPAAIRSGKIIDFGYLPSAENAQQKVWHLNFKKSYPYVRVTEDIQTGELEYMAADQITLKLADGTDVTQLKPMLDNLGLRLRMFNRKEQVAVIGVVGIDLDAVPRTIEAVQPYNNLFSRAGPDFIIKLEP